MKKFIVLACALVLSLLSVYYAIYFKGFYIDFHPDKEISVYAKIENNQILVKNKLDQYHSIIIKGVDLPSSIADNNATDYAIDYETYLRWFTLIQEMGANTIRTYTIYDDTFYNALYDYNLNKENPLYLLQGLQVSDDANNSKEDAYSKDFYNTLKKDSIDIIDVIHGRKIITANNMKGSGYYQKDVSPYLLGYIIGNEWSPDTIEYTNHQDYSSNYKGKYFSTTENATVFEAMLTKIMDEMINYESSKYKSQSLITFASSPETDPFEYETFYAKQLNKYTSIDFEHIKTENNLLSGYFASYRLYDFCETFYNYFSSSQKNTLVNTLNNLNKSNYYTSYSQLLNEYHTMPVIISSFGYSSARGTDNINGPLNESEQGNQIITTYQDIINSGLQGAFIDSWQDSWEKRMWNTSYSIMLTENHRWHDIQSESSSYGLLSFKSNNNLIDGSYSDWPNKKLVIKTKDFKLFSYCDEVGLNLFLEKEDLQRNNEIYIPIDITPNSGTKIDQDRGLHFNRAADFLICLKPEKSQILVQSRYESLRENYLYQIERKDPFIEYPKKNAPFFVDIKMICENKNIIETNYNPEETYQAKLHDTYETGQLIEGNQAYNSLADYKYSENGIEIRIPWQLLNISNPIDYFIHDDYYNNYGVKNITVSNLYLGVGLNKEQVIKMSKIELEKQKSLKFDEYLKRSYYLIKENWGKKK